jgi:hypothetical protein
MGLPLDVLAELGAVLGKHGVKNIRHEELNALIQALSPCFTPGYPKKAKKWKKRLVLLIESDTDHGIRQGVQEIQHWLEDTNCNGAETSSDGEPYRGKPYRASFRIEPDFTKVGRYNDGSED